MGEFNFSKILSKSWKTFEENFAFFVVLALILGTIPFVISFFYTNLYVDSTLTSSDLENIPFDIIWSLMKTMLIQLSPLFILSIIFNIFIVCTLISFLMQKKKKVPFSESFSFGIKHFWRYFGFVILLGLFLILLSFLFIIPAIIFFVYWIVAPYILIRENKGPMEALKESKKLVNGKWWKMFGYIILLFIIFIVIGIFVDVLFKLISIIFLIFDPAKGLASQFVIGIVYNFYGTLTTIFAIIFGDSLYLALKGKSKENFSTKKKNKK